MTILIKNCNIIDLGTGNILPNKHIIIKSDKITNVLDTVALLNKYQFDQIIDTQNSFILPGLIDSHVHIFNEGNPNLYKNFKVQENIMKSSLRCAKNLSEAIYNGITFLRDLGSYQRRNNYIKAIIEEKIFLGPDIISCGNLITSKKGHVHELGREVIGIVNIKKAIKEERGKGADFIKVTNDPIGFSKKELEAIVNISHDLNMKVSCHSFTEESISLAIQANVDIIEHAIPFNNKMLDEILKKNITVVPTYFCALQTCKSAKQSFVSKEEMKIFRKWRDNLKKHLPVAIREGVNILAGTDAGYPPLRFYDVINEVICFNELGMSPIDALRSATINAFRVFGIDHIVGTIEKGKKADLIVFKKNPLSNLSILKNTTLVIKNGFIVKNCLS